MNTGLALLTLRRILGGGLIALFALAAWLAARVHWAPDPDALSNWLGLADPAAVVRALTVRGVWTLLLLATAPWLVFRAAGVIPRWRTGESDWLAGSPTPRAAIVASAATGLAIAASLLVLAILACAVWTAGRAPRDELRLDQVLELPTTVLDQHDRPVEVELGMAPGTDAAFVRIQLFVVGGGHAARVRASVFRGGEVRTAETLVASRTELRIPLPPPSAEGALRFEVERMGPGPIVAIASGSGQVLERASPGTAQRALALRALVGLLAWSALAFGLGAWMNAQLAGLLALALALLSFATELHIPGGDLPRVLASVGEGIGPRRLAPLEWLGAALTMAAGILLANLGLSSRSLTGWRHP